MVKAFTRLLAFSAGALVGAPIGARFLLQLIKSPTPPQCAGILDSPLRRLVRDPASTIDFIGPHRNAIVLDAGCGTGTYTLEAARRTGSGGLVHAVDIQAMMINVLMRKVEASELDNIRPHIAPLDQAPIASNSVDVAFMLSSLSETRKPDLALREMRRVLKSGGTLVVGEELPAPCYVAPAAVRRLVESAGFILTGRNGNPVCYLLKFVKPVSPVRIATMEGGMA